MANEQFEQKLTGVRDRVTALGTELIALSQPGALSEDLLPILQQAADSATIATQLAADAAQFEADDELLPPAPTAEELGLPEGTPVKQVLMMNVSFRVPDVEAFLGEALDSFPASGGCGHDCGCDHGDAAAESGLPVTPEVRTCRTPDEFVGESPAAGTAEDGHLHVPADFFREDAPSDATADGADPGATTDGPGRALVLAFMSIDVPVVIETGVIHDDVLAVAERYLQGAEQLVAYLKDPTLPNPAAQEPIESDTPPADPTSGTC